MDITHLKPERVWKHFYALTQIPRPSEKEEKIRAFMADFGKKLGLETLVDGVGNVIIRKPATPGMENRQGVILQAHMDMVPQKNNETVHDFENDPIIPRVEGEWLYATGTTLGADNGIGLAAAMAVLEADDLVHGPIELLATTEEETGMTGARDLEPGILKGDILLNTDSEDEGELYVGCAGGEDGSFLLEYQPEQVPAGWEGAHINITGLKGGHSGMDIALGRGNANKVMVRILYHLIETCEIRLASVVGGDLRNAIPRECDAVICYQPGKKEEVEKAVAYMAETIANELKLTDPDLKISVAPTEKPAETVPAETALKIVRAVYAAPNGVWGMSASMPGLVETSSNLAILEVQEGKMEVHCLLRSMVDTAKIDMGTALTCCFANIGAESSFSGAYPGWQPNMDSPILRLMQKTYKDMYGKDPEVKAIHAGLECGILGGHYPHWDMISFGPTIRSPHSPDERCLISTVQKFWDFMVETLKNVPIKE
ncbi:MAG: aminoacyl-histidine dipeptidase [Bacteroidales bacterium]|nr:aminoacyl-histidine dipeptidase [Bacteroidales bacterium]